MSYPDTYSFIDFTDIDLTGARLCGRFFNCLFNATFYAAICSGEFVDCEVV